MTHLWYLVVSLSELRDAVEHWSKLSHGGGLCFGAEGHCVVGGWRQLAHSQEMNTSWISPVHIVILTHTSRQSYVLKAGHRTHRRQITGDINAAERPQILIRPAPNYLIHKMNTCSSAGFINKLLWELQKELEEWLMSRSRFGGDVPTERSFKYSLQTHR